MDYNKSEKNLTYKISPKPLMHVNSYCQSKVAAAGSSLYYALRFLPPKQRLAPLAIITLNHEIQQVVDQCSDPALAHTKLTWWKTEIDRMLTVQATHPVTLAIQQTGLIDQFSPSLFFNLIKVAEQNLQQSRYLDFINLKQHFELESSSLYGLITQALANNHDGSTSNTTSFSLAMRLADMIINLGQDARQGRIYLPINELQEYQVKAADILNKQYSSRFYELLCFQYQRSIDSFKESLTANVLGGYPQKTFYLVLAALKIQQLKEIKSNHFQVLHQHIELTPIRNFAIAWKAHLFQDNYLTKLLKT